MAEVQCRMLAKIELNDTASFSVAV